MATNLVTTTWKENMQFESDNPSGLNLFMDAGEENGGKGEGYRPKALMLSSLAGCSGLDVVSLLKKMHAEVAEFRIDITAELTEEHPKFYNKVKVDYHFSDSELKPKKIQKAVNLSVTKYCGVMEMFRQFAEVEIEIFLHEL
jgi:putative redox protein